MATVVQLAVGVTEAQIQAAINALPTGGTLVLPKGQTILITKGLVANVGVKGISIDLNGSTLKQAGDVTVLTVKGNHDAATLVSDKLVDAGGDTVVKVASTAGIAVGDWVKMVSDDILPNDQGTTTRLGQAMQVVAINGTSITLDGQPLYADQYLTNVRISGYNSGAATISNGIIQGDQTHPEWVQDLFEVRSTIGTVITGVQVRDGNSMGFNIVDSVNTKLNQVVAVNLSDDTTTGRYGYGVHSGSSLNTVVDGLYAEKVRHATDDNAVGSAPGEATISKYGADIGLTVLNSMSVGATAYAWDWHSEGRNGVVDNTIAINNYGVIGGRGLGHVVTDSAGWGNQRGVIFYEYGLDDGSNITVDNLKLLATTEVVTQIRGVVSGNAITNSLLQYTDKNQDISATTNMLGTTVEKTVRNIAETLTGTTGTDKLLAGDGNDIVKAGAGDDFIWGGTGADSLWGGTGSDRFTYVDLNEAGDTIWDFKAGSGGDQINLAGLAGHYGWQGDLVASGHVRFAASGSDTLVKVSVNGLGTDNVTLATLKGVAPGQLTAANLSSLVSIPKGVAGQDAAKAAMVDPLTLTGTAANDILGGGDGDDRLDGGDGDDLLAGGEGADNLIGGLGIDTVTYAIASAGVSADLNTPAGNTGEAAGDRYTGVENLIGSAFNDTLGGANGVSDLAGGDGDDRLFGFGGADKLSGGQGNDWLVGGSSKDMLTGGAGADSFVFETRADFGDTITDFVKGQDKIVLDSTALGLDDGFTFVAGLKMGSLLGPTLFFDTLRDTLYLDADGIGLQAAQAIATIKSDFDITLSDLVLI